MNRKNLIISAVAAALVLLTGCTSIDERSLEDATATSTNEQITVATTAATTIVTTTTTTTTTEATTVTSTSEILETSDSATELVASTIETVPIVESYETYTFNEDDQIFLSNTVFVGDSICRGLSAYGVIPTSNVFAQGNIGARSIFDYTFTYGDDEVELLTALVNAKAKNIVFSMGMNDINMTSAETYVENYTYLLNMVSTYCPEATMIVVGITPVTDESNFVANQKIRDYNAALAQMVEDADNPLLVFVDATDELVNSNGALKSNYESGDGLHLNTGAYYAILWKICQVCNNSDAETDAQITTIVTTNSNSSVTKTSAADVTETAVETNQQEEDIVLD